MKTLEDIEAREITGGELVDLGYSLMSYDGEHCLSDNQRIRQNVNDNGELTLTGAKVFAENVLRTLPDVEDIKIIFGGQGYDVYALTN